MATLAPLPKIKFFDSNGEPLANGKLYTYTAGTSTPLATYTDSTGGSSNTNPVILDSRGEANVWLGSGTYKFVLKDSNDVTIYTVDNIAPALDASSTSVFSNKTLDNTNIITVKDSNFTLQDNSDTTKQANFQLSGLATGTTKTFTLPDWSGTVQVSEAETSVASAGTTDLGAVDSNNVLVTGTTGITAFGTVAAGIRKWVRFNNTLTITHNGTSLILPFGRDLVTVDNMTIEALSLGSGNWRVTSISNSTETSKIQPITASVGSNAMTVTLNPTILDFRSATLGSGTVNTRSIGSAISVVIPSTATMGTTSGVANRIAVLAIDNSGTVELAVCNVSGSLNLDESTVISTTTIDTAADSASVIYSTTGRSNVPFRLVGFVESTQATAGTWATAPSTIQGSGGAVEVASRIRSNAVVSASSTSVDLTGIPTWAKRVTVMLSLVSTNGSSPLRLQLGDSGGIETSGYTSLSTETGGANVLSTSGFDLATGASSYTLSGTFELTNITGTEWICTAQFASGTVNNSYLVTGTKATSVSLDRVRLTTVGGTDAFDGGTINILYE